MSIVIVVAKNQQLLELKLKHLKCMLKFTATSSNNTELNLEKNVLAAEWLFTFLITVLHAKPIEHTRYFQGGSHVFATAGTILQK